MSEAAEPEEIRIQFPGEHPDAFQLFAKTDELVEFCKGESKFWTEMLQPNSELSFDSEWRNYGGSAAFKSVSQMISRVRKVLNRAITSLQEPESAINEVEAINRVFADLKLPRSTSVVGRAIAAAYAAFGRHGVVGGVLALAPEGVEVIAQTNNAAAYTNSCFLSIGAMYVQQARGSSPAREENSDVLIAEITASAERRLEGFVEQMRAQQVKYESEAERLSGLADRYISKGRESFDEMMSSIEAEREHTREMIEHNVNSGNQLFRAMMQKIEVRHNAFVDQFERSEQAVSKFLTLSPAATYWEDRAEKSATIAEKQWRKFWWLLAGGIAVIGSLIVVLFLDHTVSEWSYMMVTGSETPAPKTGPVDVEGLIKRVVVVAAPLTLLIYGLRIMAKLAMTAEHTALDAKERVSVIQTYQALIHEEGEIGKQAFDEVVRRLTRPTATGLVESDPISPITIGSLKA